MYTQHTPKADNRRPHSRERGISGPGVDEPVSTSKPAEDRRLHPNPGFKIMEEGSTGFGPGARFSENDEDVDIRAVSADSRHTTLCESRIVTYLEPKLSLGASCVRSPPPFLRHLSTFSLSFFFLPFKFFRSIRLRNRSSELPCSHQPFFARS